MLFILSKGIFFNICVLSRRIVYWIHFQNIHALTYRKTSLHTLLLLAFKIIESLQCILTSFRSSHRRCSVKKGIFKNFANFTGKYQCWGLFLIKLQERLQFYWKETPILVFSYEICEISKNIYFEEHLQTTASEVYYFSVLEK